MLWSKTINKKIVFAYTFEYRRESFEGNYLCEPLVTASGRIKYVMLDNWQIILKSSQKNQNELCLRCFGGPTETRRQGGWDCAEGLEFQPDETRKNLNPFKEKPGLLHAAGIWNGAQLFGYDLKNKAQLSKQRQR